MSRSLIKRCDGCERGGRRSTSVAGSKWGAAIARANAGLRRARLEYVGGRGNRVREYAADVASAWRRRARWVSSWLMWAAGLAMGLATPPLNPFRTRIKPPHRPSA